MKDLMKMMKQAQEIQGRMQRMQEEQDDLRGAQVRMAVRRASHASRPASCWRHALHWQTASEAPSGKETALGDGCWP